MERVQVEQGLKITSRQYILCSLLSLGPREACWECWLWRVSQDSFSDDLSVTEPVILKGFSTAESKARRQNVLPGLGHCFQKCWCRLFCFGGEEPELLALPNLQTLELTNLLELCQMSQTEENKNNFYICDKKISERKSGFHVSVHTETMSNVC